MGGEEDNILLDGDLVGSAGPQDIDPFDSTTFSLALGDISQGKHSIRIVSQSRSLCIGGINCENDLADGYHWVDALKLSGDANCPTAISGDPGAPAITNVDWALRPNNNLIVEFDVDVDSSSEVWIEYQAVYGEDGVLKTHPTPMSSNSHHLDVMRLLADTEYCFQVFARNDAGQVSDSMQGSFRTGPLPAELASSSFRLVSGVPTSYPLTLLNHQTGDFDGIVAVDSRANVVWYQDGHNAGDIVQDPDNYNLLFISGQVIKEIAPTGELVHESPDVCSIPLSDPSTQGIQGGAHHEVLPPDGDLVMYLGWVIKDPFNDPERLQRGDTIRQWNRQTGEDVQIWDPFEFLDPFNDRTESSNFPSRGMGCDGNTPNEDWTHSNSLQVVPAGNARPEEDDNILMSVRDVNEIISIEPDLSGIAWRLGDATQLGNSTSDFTFPNPDDQFYRQHSARQLPNGNILLFDNGTLRPASEGGEYSRALELELDMQNMTATKVWEYRHNPDLFSRIVSNVNRLENGNTVVVFGADQSTDECCRIFTLVEADDQPEANALTVIEISAPGKSLQYRVHPVQTLSGEEEK
jgi:hypothetical protein